MKKLFQLFTILIALVFASPSFAQAASSIVFTWTNTNPSVPNCTSAVTNACLVGLTLTDTTTTASPVVLSSSISPTATTYTTPLPAFTASTRTYSLVVNYKDANGASQATVAANTSVGVQLVINAPTGFSAKTQ